LEIYSSVDIDPRRLFPGTPISFFTSAPPVSGSRRFELVFCFPCRAMHPGKIQEGSARGVALIIVSVFALIVR
jgi:hypothetical protein